jgi:endonuclease III
MVRGPDGVDLGLWRGVPTSALVVPLDTHVARVARRLGLTRRRDLSWRTAEEVTGGLRVADAGDPVRFDFALCHLGMSGHCPPRRDPERCAICLLADGCEAGAVSAPGRPAARGSRSARAGRS